MTDFTTEENIHDILAQVAFQMKETMGTMHAALQRVAPPEARDADGELDENAAVLTRNFYRLRRLSGNLEEAANLDAPHFPPLSNDDIVGLVRRVTERAQYAAQLLGLTLEFKSERSSQIIAMDADRIERLLLNLLSNAFKFTPRGGAVTVEVRVLPRQVELRVIDNGCGISSDKLEHLYDRYRRMNIPDGMPQGLGLGLPISRRIAQDHGGTLLVTSREGEGTTVLVTLENRKTSMITMESFPIGDYAGGFDHTLLELSDAVGAKAFLSKLID